MHQNILKTRDQASWSRLFGSLTLVAIAPLTAMISQSQTSLSPQSDQPGLAEQEEFGPLVENLSNANYRFISAEISTATTTTDGLPLVSAEDLAEVKDGYAFVFQKIDARVVGMLYQLESQERICVSGEVEGNTISGQAIARYESPFEPVQVLSKGEEFVPWGESAETLKIREGNRTGIRVVYDSALLDLDEFYRVNAGSQPPPEKCV